MLGIHPFISYYGGKWRAALHYPPPLHRTIIEPFAGAAGYALRYFDRNVILVERNPKVAATWRYLLRASAEEIRALPLIEAEESVEDLFVCEEARFLIGWWINKGTAAPRCRPSAWMRSSTHNTSFWGPKIRERIASQVDSIRHWQLIEGDYTDAPNITATWFIDPPYVGAGKHYPTRVNDFAALGAWCQARQGQVMVCENVGATWLPFRPFLRTQTNPSSRGGKTSYEAL